MGHRPWLESPPEYEDEGEKPTQDELESEAAERYFDNQIEEELNDSAWMNVRDEDWQW